jgi:hypothetical protein
MNKCIYVRKGIQANTRAVGKMKSLIFLYLCPVQILWNSAHAVGGSDEALWRQWEESCSLSRLFLFRNLD